MKVDFLARRDAGDHIGTLLGIFACGVLFFVIAMPALIWVAGVALEAGR